MDYIEYFDFTSTEIHIIANMVLSYYWLHICIWYISDQYILPKIAERDLRRFRNLRASATLAGVQVSLEKVSPNLYNVIIAFIVSFKLLILSSITCRCLFLAQFLLLSSREKHMVVNILRFLGKELMGWRLALCLHILFKGNLPNSELIIIIHWSKTCFVRINNYLFRVQPIAVLVQRL